MRILFHSIKQWTTHWQFLFGAALSLAVGSACYFATANTIESDALQRFNNLVRSTHFTLLSRVKSYTDVLRGSAGLFHASPEVTYDQFHRYVRALHLDTEFPGIETINYAVLVKDKDRPEFERQMNAEMARLGKPESFKIVPPGRRDEYLVLTMIEPATAAVGRLGFDVAAGPRSLAPLFRSRDTGGVAASGRPIPMPKSITGLGIRLPVYRGDMPTRSVAERRAAYIGSVGIGFSVEGLLGGLLSQLPVQGMHLRLIGLVDDDLVGKRQRVVLYDSVRRLNSSSGANVPQEDEFNLTLPIEFSERTWETQFRIKKAALMTGIDRYIPWLSLIAGFVSTALLYALFQALSSSRRRAISLAEDMTKELRASEANLQLSNTKLRELAAHADNIKEGERKRIAREIHDDLGQNLLALRIEADLLASRTGIRHPLLHSRAERTLHQIDSTIKSVRQIINDLRPNVLDLGLNAAVDWQIAEFQRRTGIDCELIENDEDIQIGDHGATALFRILQESLTNISRHANASSVRVELWVGGGRISMTVSDNGRGMQPGGRHRPGSFGLVGIEERVKILDGSFSIKSGQATGTTISVSLPLREPSLAAARESNDSLPARAGSAMS
jgi:signal transduction histidine kinase